MRDTFFFRGAELDEDTIWSMLLRHDNKLSKEAQTINIEAFLKANGPSIKYIVEAKKRNLLQTVQTMQTETLTADVKDVVRPDVLLRPSLQPIFDVVKSEGGNSTSDENWGGFVLALHAACNKSYDIPAGAFAFHEFQNSTLQVPAGFKKIGNMAFQSSDLKKVVLPETITSIYTDAFRECKLTSINFPVSLERIYFDAFIFSSIEDVQFDAPSQIKEIADGCFAHCRKLKDVRLPDTLKIIEKSAFQECKKLQSISFPETLQSIERQAFQDCSSLQQLEFPIRLKKIDEDAFRGSGILSVRFPTESRLKIIEHNTFRSCERFESGQAA